MKQTSTTQLASGPPPDLPAGAVDNATLELLAAWKAQDATTDPEQIRAAKEEVEDFKKAINHNRIERDETILFP